MKLHANARTCPKSRQEIVRRVLAGRPRECVAAEFGISQRTVAKWLARFRAEGELGLLDRSSAPTRVARRTDPRRVAAVAALRRLRFSGPEIAELLEMPPSTTSAVLKREGLGKLGRIGLEPARRYERARPGELIHIDVKKLGRIQGGAGKRARDGLRQHYQPTFTDREGKRRNTVGWECVHIAIDDATRLAYAEVLPDEKATTSVEFLRRTIAFYARHGISVERLLTDNGAPYRSAVHALSCRALGIRHLRTRPYRPQTNGKAERFIRTMLTGWAYSGATYGSSTERTAALDGWLHHYNHHRRHQAIGRQPPIQRLNNLLGSYI
jgi:transposase InsO family protein